MAEERCMIHILNRRYKPCSNPPRVTIYRKKGRGKNRRVEPIHLCYEHWVKIANSNMEW